MPCYPALKLVCFCALVLTLGSGANASSGSGDSDPARYCDAAATAAARETGVPESILKAITRVETGTTRNGRFGPWPWTVNVEGVGKYFANKTEAAGFIREQHLSGKRSIDAGCFQINLRWHGDHFASPEQVLDPVENAMYAAEFLRTLHMEFGNWDRAAAAFHSRNEDVSKPYLAKFQTALAAVRSNRSTEPLSQQNAFPLLQGRSNSGDRGSLFPQTQPSQGLLFTAKQRG